MEKPIFIRPRKAFVMLGVSETIGYKLIHNGTLGAVKVGGRWLIPLSNLEALQPQSHIHEKDELPVDRKGYSPQETAQILGISMSLVRKLIKNGTIPHVRLGEKGLLYLPQQ